MLTTSVLQLTLEWGGPGDVRHGHELPAALVPGVGTAVFTQQLRGGGGAF